MYHRKNIMSIELTVHNDIDQTLTPSVWSIKGRL
jgi:hypothetical protein